MRRRDHVVGALLAAAAIVAALAGCSGPSITRLDHDRYAVTVLDGRAYLVGLDIDAARSGVVNGLSLAADALISSAQVGVQGTSAVLSWSERAANTKFLAVTGSGTTVTDTTLEVNTGLAASDGARERWDAALKQVGRSTVATNRPLAVTWGSSVSVLVRGEGKDRVEGAGVLSVAVHFSRAASSVGTMGEKFAAFNDGGKVVVRDLATGSAREFDGLAAESLLSLGVSGTGNFAALYPTRVVFGGGEGVVRSDILVGLTATSW